MGLRGKVILGLVLFFVIFGLRFLCANCQQVEVDLSAESSRSQSHPQPWKAVSTTITFSEWEKSSKDELSPNPYETWPSDETPLRRRRPGVRKRKRRPQGFTTESMEKKNHWSGDIQHEVIHVMAHDEYEPSVPPQYEFYSSQPTKLHQTNRKLPLTSPTTKFNERNEKVREPMAALEREQKLSEIREKQKELLIEGATTTKNSKSYRRPYSQVKREREENSNEDSSPKPTVDLKNILKSSGSLSLSEILQQKNLSLDDLLKGKQNALLALQTTSPAPIPYTTPRFTKPVRRIPWSYISSTSISMKSKNPVSTEEVSRNENQMVSTEKSSKLPSYQTPLSSPIPNDTNLDEIENIVEIATIATLRDNPPVRRLSNQTIRNVIFPMRLKSTSTSTTTTSTTIAPTTTTPTTEISTPGTKAEIDEVESKTEVSTFRQEVRPSFVPQYRRRPPIKPRPKITPILKYSSQSSSSSSSSESSSSDSSSESKKSRPGKGEKQEHIDNHPDSIEDRLRETLPEDNLIEKFTPLNGMGNKVVSTTLEELFGSPIQSKAPERPISITPRIDRFHKTSSSDELDVTERNPSLFLDLTSDRSVDDRTDLLELIEDRRSGGRLFKILAQRNMSLEELIEHRRRGSSQLHLADIIQNKSKTFPEATGLSSPFDDSLDIVTAFENFPHFNLANLKSVNPDEIKTDSQGSSYFTSIIDIEPTDEAYKESRSMKTDISALPALDAQKETNLPLKASPELTNGKAIHNPNWDTMSVASYTSQENSIDFKRGSQGHMPSNVSPPKEQDVEDPVLRIEDEVARAHDLLDLELSGHGFKRSTINIESAQMPTGIRSAIVASSAIVATSLLVFLVIFVICKWRQKRRNKLSYIDNYTAIKSRLPIISRQTAMKRFSDNSSPIIFPGSKSCKLNTMDPNAPEVQEYLFDTIRKPF